MDRNQDQPTSTSSSRAMFGVAIAGILCCGLPILLLTLGLTTAGTFLLVNRFYILGGMIVLMGAFMFVGWKRKKSTQATCRVSPVHKGNDAKSKQQ